MPINRPIDGQLIWLYPLMAKPQVIIGGSLSYILRLWIAIITIFMMQRIWCSNRDPTRKPPFWYVTAIWGLLAHAKFWANSQQNIALRFDYYTYRALIIVISIYFRFKRTMSHKLGSDTAVPCSPLRANAICERSVRPSRVLLDMGAQTWPQLI